MIIGLLMLPFNLHHLGTDAYGLWMLLGSMAVHFSVLDLGYGGALVKFMAQYRAHRERARLNEIASTLFFVFAGIGVLAYAGRHGRGVQPRSHLPPRRRPRRKPANGSC